MAISPPSDIVLDVAKAVDPLQYRAAVEKLARLSDAKVDATGSFAALLDSVEADATEAVEPFADPMRADLRYRVSPVEAPTEAQPYQQFEAFVLQTFIQQMLPKDAEHVFGDGLAGSFWSSMLAEQIAGQLAKAGGIGIADLMTSQSQHRGGEPSALPGYMTSLELSFANSILPSADSRDEGTLKVGES